MPVCYTFKNGLRGDLGEVARRAAALEAPPEKPESVLTERVQVDPVTSPNPVLSKTVHVSKSFITTLCCYYVFHITTGIGHKWTVTCILQ